MTTTKLFNTLKLVTLGMLLSIGLSYAAVISQQTWNPGAPTTDNVDVPINATAGPQEKRGNLSVNTFAALGDAHLKQQAFIRGALKGIDPGSSDPTLDIGGTSSAGARERVVATSTGNWYSGKTIGSTTLINNNLIPLCSTTAGQVVLCPTGGSTPPPVVPSDIEISNLYEISQPGNAVVQMLPTRWYSLVGAGFPVNPNLTRFGTHTGFSGQLSVHVQATIPGLLTITNQTTGTRIGCQNFNGSMSVVFPSITIPASADVLIEMEPGIACS